MAHPIPKGTHHTEQDIQAQETQQQDTDIPIIGVGGIERAEDVIEMMLAGATAVEVGAANLKNPYACKEIIENLPEAMKKYGITNLSEIIGKAH